MFKRVLLLSESEFRLLLDDLINMYNNLSGEIKKEVDFFDFCDFQFNELLDTYIVKGMVVRLNGIYHEIYIGSRFVELVKENI